MPLRASRTLIATAVCAVAPAAYAADEEAPPDADLRARTPVTDVARAGFAFSGEYGVTNSGRAELTRGLTARALLLGSRRGSLAVVAGVSDMLADYLGAAANQATHHIQEHAMTALRTGLSASWGAPFRPWRWGIALDVGFESVLSRRGSTSSSPYGGFEMRIGLCRCTAFRPFVAGTGRMVLDQFGEHVETATAGLGFAWVAD